jgi:hypothetical protein
MNSGSRLSGERWNDGEFGRRPLEPGPDSCDLRPQQIPHF